MRKELNVQECDATEVQSLFCSSAHKKILTYNSCREYTFATSKNFYTKSISFKRLIYESIKVWRHQCR